MKKYKIILIYIYIAVIAIMLSSCGNYLNNNITASKIDQPVSYTSYVFNKKGEIIRSEDKNILKHFIIKKRYWSMLYSTINLTKKTVDISDDLRQQIEEVKGNAIVNLKIEFKINFFYMWLNPIILPNTQVAIIEGDVVLLPNN